MISICEMTEYTARVKDGLEDVKPGMPASFTTASTAGDCIWQGDLGIVISDSDVPAGFVKVKEKGSIFQLVPGKNSGSRHCVALDGSVQVYIPSEWNEESLIGPFMKVIKNTTITHPVHGNVSIPAGFCVELIYQQEWDRVLAAERLARD